MNTRIRLTLFALAAAAGCGSSATAQVAAHFDTLEIAAEVPAGKVRLPAGPDSWLVMPSCGTCPPKSYRITPTTAYYIGNDRVSLRELAAAISGQPNAPLTVSYSTKTEEVTRVTADIVMSARARGR